MRSNFSKTRFYNLLKENRVILIYFPLAVYWIALLILTSIPSDSIPSLFGISDKLEHFGAYFLLAFLLALVFHLQEKYEILKKKYFLFGAVISLFYGILDELHQYFIPGRYCELWDFIANLVGSLLGVYLAYCFIQYLTIRYVKE